MHLLFCKSECLKFSYFWFLFTKFDWKSMHVYMWSCNLKWWKTRTLKKLTTKAFVIHTAWAKEDRWLWYHYPPWFILCWLVSWNASSKSERVPCNNCCMTITITTWLIHKELELGIIFQNSISRMASSAVLVANPYKKWLYVCTWQTYSFYCSWLAYLPCMLNV